MTHGATPHQAGTGGETRRKKKGSAEAEPCSGDEGETKKLER